MDFIKFGSQITVDWAHKIVNASNDVSKIELYVSTRPGGIKISSYKQCLIYIIQ